MMSLSDGGRREVLAGLNLAVAIADPETGDVLFENSRFFNWFPAPVDSDAALWDRVAVDDWEAVRQRVTRRGKTTVETQSGGEGRSVPVNLILRKETIDGAERLIVEGHDASKLRETEYLLDSYSKMAEKRNRELEREKARAEKLLLNLMPRLVYEELRDFGTTTPQRFDPASVLMLDFVGFTEMAVSREPGTLVSELNDIFTAFDRIIELFGCERIKTMGDGYMAVCGLPEPNAEHATNLVKAAVRMRRYLRRRNESHPQEWICRIGIATGTVIGSIVGIQKYVYDVFGPAVNLAARLETLADPMQIVVSGAAREALAEEFEIEPLGSVEVKGFGDQALFAVTGEPATRR